MFKAVFFDLDETLVDSSDCHSEAERKAFTDYHIDYAEIESRVAKEDITGKRVNDILKIMKEAMNISEEQLPLNDLITTREKYFLNLVKADAKLLPGAKDAIQFVKKKKQISAIVSSGTRKYLNLCIEKFKLAPYVDFIVGAEDVERGKPFPDCYEKAYMTTQSLQTISKPECLVVEDSVNGIKAAQAAGLPVCFVPLFTPREKLSVDFKIKSLTEFSSTFDQLL